MDFVVIETDENRPVFPQKLPEQRESGIHHAEPAIVSVERFALLADYLAQPLTDDRAVDVVVVGPTLVARVVRRIDVDALDLSRVVGKERFERDEVIAP